MAVTGLADQAWPELFEGRPAILYSRLSGPVLSPIAAGDGWAAPGQPDGWAGPHPGWSAELDGKHLMVARPGGLPWYDGTLAVTWQWRRAARNHQAVLQITGPFAHPFEFPDAARRGALLLVVAPLRFTTDTW